MSQWVKAIPLSLAISLWAGGSLGFQLLLRIVGKLPYLARYVDDYFGLCEGSLQQFQQFVEKLNTIHPNIKLTFELEADQRISFLDILVTRHQDKPFFATSVHRKACFTGRAMPPSSYCEHRYKLAAIRSAVHRAKTYCNTSQALKMELQYIRKQFKGNGYKDRDIEQTINQVLYPKFGPMPAPPIRRIGIEYSGPMFFQIKKLAKKHLNIQFVSKSSNSLRCQLFSKVKPSTPPLKTSQCVYSISCDCDQIYVGQTGRELHLRVKEHESSWGKGDDRSGFGAHHDHNPSFSDTRVVAVERNEAVRLLKEAACIRRTELCGPTIPSTDAKLNRIPGALIPDTWLPALPLIPDPT